jgi:hypothetical protein
MITNNPFDHQPFWIPDGNTMHEVHYTVSPKMGFMGGHRTQMSATMDGMGIGSTQLLTLEYPYIMLTLTLTSDTVYDQ